MVGTVATRACERLALIDKIIKSYHLFLRKRIKDEAQKPVLLHAAGGFSFTGAVSMTNAVLQKLYFLQQHEMLASCQEVRAIRIKTSVPKQIMDGQAFLLTTTGDAAQTAYSRNSSGDIILSGKPKQEKVEPNQRECSFILHKSSMQCHLLLTLELSR